MIDDIISEAAERMTKSLGALDDAFKRIRTGRAHPSILDSVMVSYYGSETPLNQLANVTVEEGRSLLVSPWEKNLIGDVEKAIMKSDLGLNPVTAGSVIRVPMPALTEETRKGYIRQARKEAENSRISVRNIRRDILSEVKKLLKEKEISEDDERKFHDEIQKITDSFIASIDEMLKIKEGDLLEI